MNLVLRLQLLTVTPATENDAMFRELLAVSTAAVGDNEAIQMGVSLGIPELLGGLSSAVEHSEKLKAAVADAVAVFRC